MELCELSFGKITESLETGEFSARDLAASVLDRIESREREISAYLIVRDRAEVLADADRADAVARRCGRRGPLHGVPVAVKDNIAVRGLPTTCGSRILEGFLPPFDATAVERLRGAGAVVVGKTNLDEFAMGSSNEYSAFGPTRNPWDPTRVAGGSSGGSAAAVAACEAVLALGSDTGGSVRLPAAFCGVVGIKPTYGRVSRYGLVAFASSLDQIGAIARDVAGAAALIQCVAGEDPRDSTTSDRPVDGLNFDAPDGLSGVRVGVVSEFLEANEPSVDRAVRRTVDLLGELGASVEPISVPHMAHAIAAYYTVADAEASSNLARYDGVVYGTRAPGVSDLAALYERTRTLGFGPEVKRRIMLGTYALSAGYYDDYYLKAQKVRSLIIADFESVFETVDVVVGPTSPTTAFRFGEKCDDPLTMYRSDVYTVGANLTGAPAVSLPCGTDAAGLPIGFQIMADRFRERDLLRVASVLERAIGFTERPCRAGG